VASQGLSSHLVPVAGDGGPWPWLWLGTWSLGGEGFGPHDAGDARAVLAAALAEGVRYVDTAGFYAHGHSEELIAGALRERRRQQFFISTKGGLRWSGREVVHRGDAVSLREDLEASLVRLGTDYVDLFQLHWPDPGVPIADSIAALEALCRAGLARHWGVGNLAASEVRELIPPGQLTPHQVSFSPLNRAAADVLAAGRRGERCLNCVVSPLEQGLLGSGRGSRGLADLGKRDVRRRNPRFSDPACLAWAEELRRLCARVELTPVAAVLAWLLGRDDVDIVVPGPRQPKQLAELLVAANWIERARGDGESLAETGDRALAEHLERGPGSTGGVRV
jgi:aryl-alcohol dehydrogenase-like predicted oxidoreductase